MVDNLCPVLDTSGIRVFCPAENTGQHKEFRPKVLSFLSLSALDSIRDRAKTLPIFLHPKPFLDHQGTEVRHVANLKRRYSRPSAPDDASFLCPSALNVIWRYAHKTKISGLVADKEAGLLVYPPQSCQGKPLCDTHDFS